VNNINDRIYFLYELSYINLLSDIRHNYHSMHPTIKDSYTFFIIDSYIIVQLSYHTNQRFVSQVM